MLIWMRKLLVARGARCAAAFLFAISFMSSTFCADDARTIVGTVVHAGVSAGMVLAHASGRDKGHGSQIHHHQVRHDNAAEPPSGHGDEHKSQDCNDCSGHVHCCTVFLIAVGTSVVPPWEPDSLNVFAGKLVLGLPASTLERPPRYLL